MKNQCVCVCVCVCVCLESFPLLCRPIGCYMELWFAIQRLAQQPGVSCEILCLWVLTGCMHTENLSHLLTVMPGDSHLDMLVISKNLSFFREVE